MNMRAFSSILLIGLFTSACDVEETTRLQGPEEAIGPSMAMGLWSPSGPDTCTRAIHDAYQTIGPDGMIYPTWHPPVDPATGCTFGHEHGRDPSGSDLFAEVGPIPFGYANEHLAESGFGAMRSEDHFGHKIEWENDMVMQVGSGGTAAISVTCDVIAKLHQGTHSPDAFTNNLHEVAYHIRCSDGTGFSATLLAAIGKAGEMVVQCNRDRHIPVGTATPPNSPDGGGKRALPEVACLGEHVFREDGRPRFDAALRESWEVSGSLRRENGRVLASFNPYFQVMDPSRYFDPGQERSMGRPVDLCVLPGVMGKDRCSTVTPAGVAWNDPASPFKGVRRFVDINGNRVQNAGGPTVWYTDPLGRNGRPEPFPGSIRQWVASHDNEGLDLHGPVIGRDRSYDAPGVRAPN